MVQRFRKFALFIGAASAIGAGLIVVACGTDNGSATPTPTVDGSKPDSAKGDGGVDLPDDDAGPGQQDASDVDCGNNPKLRDFSTGLRCAFLDSGTDAGPVCPNNETCCNTSDKVGTAFQPTFCAPGAKGGTYEDGKAKCAAEAPNAKSSFMTGNAWQCADKNQCDTGQICCMIQDPARLATDPKNTLNIGNTPKTDTKHPVACGVQRVYNEGGSRCRTPVGNNCPDATEIKLCSLSDNNCGAGTTCTPFIDFQGFVDRGYCK
ncbi:MAG: hypothetical protein JWP97_2972 [Labilithrix sp.]|nr:hypothetical protein [Labilithrix sp.]